MPTSFTIDPDRRVVIFRVSGEMTLAGVAETRQQVKHTPLFDPTYDQLVDIREVTEIHAGWQQIWKASRESVFSPQSRIAVVMPRERTVIFGLARMCEILRNARDPGRVGLFNSLEAAFAWLVQRN